MLEVRVKYILMYLGKFRLLIECILGRFVLGILYLEGEKNEDLGLMF